jgi:hypothetical protein
LRPYREGFAQAVFEFLVEVAGGPPQFGGGVFKNNGEVLRAQYPLAKQGLAGGRDDLGLGAGLVGYRAWNEGQRSGQRYTEEDKKGEGYSHWV